MANEKKLLHRPVALIIRDGWGESPGGQAAVKEEGNATLMAKTPVHDDVLSKCPCSKLQASGEAVGLPDGQMGNSEVGHLNLGAGRIVYQDLTRISLAIKDGSFFDNEELGKAIDTVNARGSSLHLMGLCSDGGVHSHIEHLFALLEMAKKKGVKHVYIHAMTDGRDCSPTSGMGFVEQLQNEINRIGIGKIATVIGRYFIMDRDKRWERTEKAYRAIVDGEGEIKPDPVAAVKECYGNDVTDEFLPSLVIRTGDEKPDDMTIKDNDVIIFFNFRRDRTRQITRALMDEDFDGFQRDKLKNLYFLCLTEYDETFGLPIAFPPQSMTKILGEVLSENGITQLRSAETEKYPHVTFFFNGGLETPYEGEERLMAQSPKVATYDLQPEMSAYPLTENVIEKMKTGEFDVLILNYANPDMVGHTGVIEAAVKACETVDECLGRVLECIKELGGSALVTADHGNAEQMIDPNGGGPHTAHTTNLVNLFYYGADQDEWTLKDGILADIAPTILALLGVEKPQEMTGASLLVKKA